MLRFPTGALPTPRHVLASATPYKPLRTIPDTFLALPSQLSYWLNDTYGDCVTAEEAFNLAAQYAYGFGQAEIFVSDSEVKSWAKSHGVLNGADLSVVLSQMAARGFLVDNQVYDDGIARAVDWTVPSTFKSSVYEGPVKLGVASSQLQNVSGIGGANGWWAFGFTRDANEDHCISACGYGTAASLAAAFNRVQPSLKLTVPASINPSEPCYAIFTWGGVGIIVATSLEAITGEAWLRSPNVVGIAPTPAPVPVPTPTPAALCQRQRLCLCPCPCQRQRQRQRLCQCQRQRQRQRQSLIGCSYYKNCWLCSPS